jgi:hypothetical protein
MLSAHFNEMLQLPLVTSQHVRICVCVKPWGMALNNIFLVDNYIKRKNAYYKPGPTFCWKYLDSPLCKKVHVLKWYKKWHPDPLPKGRGINHPNKMSSRSHFSECLKKLVSKCPFLKPQTHRNFICTEYRWCTIFNLQIQFQEFCNWLFTKYS